MNIPRVYSGLPLAINLTVSLSADTSKYVTRVLRRSTGDVVELFNGDGNNYLATLTATGKDTQATITAVEKNLSESPLDITLVQSLAKGAKLDLVIQKATELGVQRISPVSNDRSVLRVENDRLDRKMQHWKNIAVSACAQCQRSSIPLIDPPVNFTSWLKNANPSDAFMLHPDGGLTLANVKIDALSCTIIIGPEGGFSADELDRAREYGIRSVRCGPRVLRTETAGFTAIAIIQSRFGDLG